MYCVFSTFGPDPEPEIFLAFRPLSLLNVPVIQQVSSGQKVHCRLLLGICEPIEDSESLSVPFVDSLFIQFCLVRDPSCKVLFSHSISMISEKKTMRYKFRQRSKYLDRMLRNEWRSAEVQEAKES